MLETIHFTRIEIHKKMLINETSVALEKQNRAKAMFDSEAYPILEEFPRGKKLQDIDEIQISEKRLLGAYYTPKLLASTLVKWALADKPHSILDPSYGEGMFLKCAKKYLQENHGSQLGELVFGVDIDSSNKESLLELGFKTANLLHLDFLTLSLKAIKSTPFDAIVGNPPYIRHHWLKGEMKSNAFAAMEKSETKLPKSSNYWTYFVIHALRFLSSDGRLALILPESILQADYARSVRLILEKRFSQISLIHIRERFFEQTDESTVILLAKGKGPGTLNVHSVETLEDICQLINETPLAQKHVTTNNGRTLTSEALSELNSIASMESVKCFSDLAAIKIGFVTGANNFFLKSRKELKLLGIPVRKCLSIVSRANWLKGLSFTNQDHNLIVNSGKKGFLVYPTSIPNESLDLKKWIRNGVLTGIPSRYKCSIRDPWFRVNLPLKLPDAIACSTYHGIPRLAINKANLHCTNTLHALNWKQSLPVDYRSIVVAYHTSFCILWAELHGRRYGGGAIKLDIGSLRNMPIPLVSSAKTAFNDLDRLFRLGKMEEAIALADRIVLREGLGLSTKTIKTIVQTRKHLADQRRPRRRGGRNE